MRHPSSPQNVFTKILAALASAALLIAALVFSAALFIVLLAAVLIGLGILWWKTRALRRQMREMQAAAASDGGSSGRIIEGEVVRDV